MQADSKQAVKISRTKTKLYHTMELHLRATGCHLPYGITCHLT